MDDNRKLASKSIGKCLVLHLDRIPQLFIYQAGELQHYDLVAVARAV
jgi:hypothetical protein